MQWFGPVATPCLFAGKTLLRLGAYTVDLTHYNTHLRQDYYLRCDIVRQPPTPNYPPYTLQYIKHYTHTLHYL